MLRNPSFPPLPAPEAFALMLPCAPVCRRASPRTPGGFRARGPPSPPATCKKQRRVSRRLASSHQTWDNIHSRRAGFPHSEHLQSTEAWAADAHRGLCYFSFGGTPQRLPVCCLGGGLHALLIFLSTFYLFSISGRRVFAASGSFFRKTW